MGQLRSSLPDKKGKNGRDGQRNKKPCPKGSSSRLMISGYQAGDRGLNRPAAKSEGDGMDGEYHLVDAQSLRSNGSGQKNTVKKSQDAA